MWLEQEIGGRTIGHQSNDSLHKAEKISDSKAYQSLGLLLNSPIQCKSAMNSVNIPLHL